MEKFLEKITGGSLVMLIYMILMVVLFGGVIIGFSSNAIEKIQDEKVEKNLIEKSITIETQKFERVFTKEGEIIYIIDLINEKNEELVTIKLPKEKVTIASDIDKKEKMYSDLNISLFEKKNDITERNNEFSKELIKYLGSYGKIQMIKLYNK